MSEWDFGTDESENVVHLDEQHLIPTGDTEFPFLYIDKFGSYHAIHYTRIARNSTHDPYPEVSE